tara:strand:- start:463 stop:1371 length:909 start_codon:yes stop_codon:yes gene_type:complete
LKKIVRKLVSKIAPFIRYFPGWDNLVVKHCQIGVTAPKNLLGKLVNSFFWREYYSRPPWWKIDIQNKLMGGESGSEWAKYYDQTRVDFPPKKGEKKVGNLDWQQSNPALNQIIELIKIDPENYCIIQLGASSGKEISHIAKLFSQSECIYTDLYETVTSYAEKQLCLPNLNYVTCPAESIPALAQISKKSKVLIVSIGSSQYVFPENIDTVFRLLSRIKNKTIEFILDEPGSNSEINPLEYKGSIARANFSYTHNYKFYAEKNGFKTKKWNLIEPYQPQKDFYPNYQGTIHLNGCFSLYKSK